MTKFVADENIPIETVNILKEQGVDIVSVAAFAPGLTDIEVLDFANTNHRIVITFDKDFGQIVFKEKRKTEGLILLRFVPLSSQQIAKKIKQVLVSKILLENHIVVVKKDSVRVTPSR